LSQLGEQAKKLLDLVDQRTATLLQLPQLAGPLYDGLAALQAELRAISNVTHSVSAQIAELAKNIPRPQLEELATALRSLASVLAQRDAAMLERLQALDDARTRLDAVAAETHSTAQVVAGFGTRLDAVPEERRTVEGLAASIKELAQVLAQRDSLMLDSLQSSLAVHSREIKTEIRQPRTIKFVEAPHLQGGDGETRKQ